MIEHPTIAEPPDESTAIPAALPPSLLPLPLTAFEHFLLLDDRPAYPMTFYVEMHFAGRADRDALDRAVAAAARRSPLLTAHVTKSRGGLQWTGDGTTLPRVAWPTNYDPVNPPDGAPIDLRRECGLRAWAGEGNDATRFSLQFHHACCDGQGARRFIVDFLTAYARETLAGGPFPRWEPLDDQPLRRRGELTTPPAGLDAPPTRLGERLRNALSFLRRPAPLAAPVRTYRPTASNATPARLVVTAEFHRAETERLMSRIKAAGTTLNDAAITLLFRLLADWNREHGDGGPKRRLRILVPTDLRERGDRRAPAMNRLGFAFLVRTIRDCADAAALNAGVRGEMQYIKTHRLGADFVRGLELVRRVPGALPLMVQRPRCAATAVLTNLDDPSRGFRRRFPARDGYPLIGNLALRQLYGTPPIRPGTRAAFGLSSFAGQLAFSLQCDPYLFDAAAARGLLDRYVAAFREFL